jgi:hypothetical protein
MDAKDLPTKVPDVGIPHFFFDMIGRIVPGLFLIWCLLDAGFSVTLADKFDKYLTYFPATGPATALVAYVFAAYVLGFLLSSMSYLMVDSIFLAVWPLKTEWTESIRQFLSELGWKDPANCAREINRKVIEAKEIATYFIRTHPDAADISLSTSRWDAEALASRSLFLVSLAAGIYAAFRHRGWASCVYGLIAVSALLSFAHYSRGRAIRSRFQMVRVLLGVGYPMGKPNESQIPQACARPTHLG